MCVGRCGNTSAHLAYCNPCTKKRNQKPQEKRKNQAQATLEPEDKQALQTKPKTVKPLLRPWNAAKLPKDKRAHAEEDLESAVRTSTSPHASSLRSEMLMLITIPPVRWLTKAQAALPDPMLIYRDDGTFVLDGEIFMWDSAHLSSDGPFFHAMTVTTLGEWEQCFSELGLGKDGMALDSVNMDVQTWTNNTIVLSLARVMSPTML
ncbi:hypothetical protein DFH09DRAFT_1081100 [Mycena vulgaris]|nr:hypothetical protein DFH09DRAFT_1081100 [Mycena vulgaris]